ncbi:MAG: HAD hydrolase-like protein [Nanoarchaeota archaeon]|nr:HAD hydrolase-like protein [Nanoarchaeota archaeon]
MEKQNNKHDKQPKIYVKAILTDAGNILFDDSDLRGAFRSYLEEKGLMARKKDINSILDTEDRQKTLGKLDYPSKGKLEYKSSAENDLSNDSFKYSITPEHFRAVYSAKRDLAMVKPGYTREMSYEDTFKELKIPSYYPGYMGWLGERKKKIRNVPFEGVLETLEELHKKGIDIIVLSDGHRTGEDARQWMESMGIKTGIKDVITSKDLGYCKPDPRFYEHALKKYNLKKEDVVFLGHDVDEDDGAHNLGIKVIAFNYEPSDSEKLNYAVKIKKFTRLSQILEKK